jgi:hypothetical protein
MALLRLLANLVTASVFAGLVAGFLMGFLVALILAGPGALLAPDALLIAFVGATYAVMLAGPLALVLGALLWALRPRNTTVWIGSGAVTGLLFCIFFWRGADGRAEPSAIVWLALAHIVAGACAALCFRSAMRTLREETDAG